MTGTCQITENAALAKGTRLLSPVLLVVVSAMITGCATKGGITDTVPEEKMSATGDRRAVGQCVFDRVAQGQCKEEFQRLLLLDDPAAQTTTVLCDNNPRYAGTAGDTTGLEIGSAVGPGGTGMGLMASGIINAVGAGQTGYRPTFSMKLRQMGDALEATNWVLFQFWTVEERQKLLRDSFAYCTGLSAAQN